MQAVICVEPAGIDRVAPRSTTGPMKIRDILCACSSGRALRHRLSLPNQVADTLEPVGMAIGLDIFSMYIPSDCRPGSGPDFTRVSARKRTVQADQCLLWLPHRIFGRPHGPTDRTCRRVRWHMKYLINPTGICSAQAVIKSAASCTLRLELATWGRIRDDRRLGAHGISCMPEYHFPCQATTKIESYNGNRPFV